jgi:alkyl hydroperoxide reductase subunit AhpC
MSSLLLLLVLVLDLCSALPRIGQPAPHFQAKALVDKEIKDIDLAQYKGKYVVLLFYPLDFTFVCPTEILSFSEAAPRFRELGAEVLGVSVDSEYAHLAWVNTPRAQGGLGEVHIPLVSDLSHMISKEYGVLIEDKGHSLRGLFIIDQLGVLRQVTVNDLPVGRSVEETLRLVQAFQHVDVHGDVCPANWTPGKATMKPNKKDCKEYLNAFFEDKEL